MTADEPEWNTLSDALAFHDVVINRYGGRPGLANQGLVESALARPRHVDHYETEDLIVVAATYAHGLTKNHGFVDGNKRTALVCALTFLELNGASVEGDQAEAVLMFEGLAAGNVDRDTFAVWLRKMT